MNNGSILYKHFVTEQEHGKAEINSESTEAVRVFVWCGVEQKKSEAGAVTETVRKARSTLERPKSKQRRKTVHCYRKIRNKDKALL